MPRPRVIAGPFRYINGSPELVRLTVMLYVKYPMSLRNVEGLLSKRGWRGSAQFIDHKIGLTLTSG